MVHRVTRRDRLPVSRRSLLGGIAAGMIGSTLDLRLEAADRGAAARRRTDAYRLRLEAARLQQRSPLAQHAGNGDEDRYLSRIASYSKGLPHDSLGQVDPFAFDALRTAAQTGDPADFERIPMGGNVRLVNPQSGLAFDLQGPDAHALSVAAAPAFASEEQAAEIAENYWMALARDVPFREYGTDPLIARATADLSRLRGFRGPRRSGEVTPGTLFRGLTPGDLAGPFISQFLWQEAPFGAERIDRRIRTAIPGVDYLTQYGEWLVVQNGHEPSAALALDPVPRYVRSGRDIAIWVRNDVVFQAYFGAALVLLDLPDMFDRTHPYATSQTQVGFGTFGPPHVTSALCAVTTHALKATWFQKWFVHRRLRPEVFAGRLHNHVSGAASYPIHPAILGTEAVAEIQARIGAFLLPLAYPEGSPLHPTYTAGHATVAGACVTILKAFFDESAVLPNPVAATADGLALEPYRGADLTVGGELNKLASNVALGRNIAGVHWRSDATASLALGEAIALRYLAEERMCLNESFDGFTLTKFDGTQVTV